MTLNSKTIVVATTTFLTGVLTQTSVNVGGNMPLAEFIVLAIMVVLVVQWVIQRRVPAEPFRMPFFWIFIAAQIIAFSAYVITDLYRGSAPNDMIRGWSRMIFLGMDVVAFTCLFCAEASCFLWWQAGMMLGGVLAMALDGAQFDAFWKFGLGGPVTVAVFLISPLFGRFLGVVLIGALAVLHLNLDFRSMGGICLSAAMLLGVQMIPRQFRALILIPALVGGTALTFWMNNSQRGDDDERGNRSTVERTAMMMAASEAIIESPLIGQGSWFSNSRVMENFQLLRSEGARLAGVHGYAVEAEETNIAIHSQILVSVAEGGIFGGTFFIILGGMNVWALWYCTIRRASDAKTPIFIFFLLNATWNLFFSPFSGAHRIGIAAGCGLMLLLWREAHSPAAAEEKSESDPEDRAGLRKATSMTAATNSAPVIP